MASYITKFINNRRTAALLKVVRPYIDADSKVIDIGAGSCNLSAGIINKLSADVTPVDVVDHNTTSLSLEIYDGKRLKYDDKSFDIGLLVFVLHHAVDIEGLIEESLRVSKRLIIIEDVPSNRVDRKLWKRLDYLENHAQHEDIKVAHEVKSPSEWLEVFKNQNLVVVQTAKFRSFFTTFLLYPHAIFIIEAK
jgi:ubiquinone/menaquinone biosynthesis C-methylase UbiE